jgi:SAM-dependent methyltransferase
VAVRAEKSNDFVTERAREAHRERRARRPCAGGPPASSPYDTPVSAGARRDKAANREYYEQLGSDRDRFAAEPSRRNTVELVLPWLLAHLRDGDRLIDVGGGAGTYASLLVRRKDVHVVGLDLSETVVAARAQDPLLTENVVGDMEQLPFEPESFDAALFIAALHHVPDPLPALREAARVLRPGGQLFAFEPASLRARRGSAPIEGAPQEFRLSRHHLVGRVRDAGLVVEEVRGYRVAMRFLRLLGRPSERAWRLNALLDRTLAPLPLVNRAGEVVRLRARKP